MRLKHIQLQVVDSIPRLLRLHLRAVGAMAGFGRVLAGTVSLTSSQMLNVVLLRNFNVVTLLPCRFVRASAIMLSGTQRCLARKACMLPTAAMTTSGFSN